MKSFKEYEKEQKRLKRIARIVALESKLKSAPRCAVNTLEISFLSVEVKIYGMQYEESETISDVCRAAVDYISGDVPGAMLWAKDAIEAAFYSKIEKKKGKND